MWAKRSLPAKLKKLGRIGAAPDCKLYDQEAEEEAPAAHTRYSYSTGHGRRQCDAPEIAVDLSLVMRVPVGCDASLVTAYVPVGRRPFETGTDTQAQLQITVATSPAISHGVQCSTTGKPWACSAAMQRAF